MIVLMIKVTYLSHSGFLLEMADAYFLFDYYKGNLPELDTTRKLFVFVSHVHYDHYRECIFELEEQFPQIYYILSDDIQAENAVNIRKMGAHQDLEVDGCTIRTLRSTDEGVAFLVTYQDRTIYHAGDLNWWHWEEEDEAYNKMMGRSYQSEIQKIEGEEIDIAFVPVDPRLGEQYCWGLDCFMRNTDTKVVFPMHFWGNYGIFERLHLETCTQEYESRIMDIEKEGQVFLLDCKNGEK